MVAQLCHPVAAIDQGSSICWRLLIFHMAVGVSYVGKDRAIEWLYLGGGHVGLLKGPSIYVYVQSGGKKNRTALCKPYASLTFSAHD